MRLRAALLAVWLGGSPSLAAVLHLRPGQDYSVLESAQPGDEVLIDPGTYAFRVHLSKDASLSPIVIRAADPTQPPLFDYTATSIEQWPGSNTEPSIGRGAWTVTGTGYRLQHIDVRGAHNVASSTDTAAFRFVSGRDNLVVGGHVTDSDYGVEIGRGAVTVEHMVFERVGTSLTVFGGDLTARYCLSLDPVVWHFFLGGRNELLEYNWMSRAKANAGSVSVCEYGCGSTGTQPVTKHTVFRGNVFVQGPTQNIPTYLLAVTGSGDSSDSSGSTTLRQVLFLNNTFIGSPTLIDEAILWANDIGPTTELGVFNNVFESFAGALFKNSGTSTNGTLRAQGNWASSITQVTNLGPTTQGADAGLTRPGLRPLADSPLRGRAAPPASYAPESPVDREYYRDEQLGALYRPRSTSVDVGAFESSTAGPAMGPDGVVPVDEDGGSSDAGAGPRSYGAGCGCASAPLWAVLPALLLLRRRARPRVARSVTGD